MYEKEKKIKVISRSKKKKQAKDKSVKWIDADVHIMVATLSKMGWFIYMPGEQTRRPDRDGR